MRNRTRIMAALLAAGLAAAGCRPNNQLETAAALEKAGQTTQALVLYQDYLKRYPASPLTPRVDALMARDYAQSADYANAIVWYEKLAAQFPQSPETLQGLLEEAALYRDKLKNRVKADEVSQRAVSQYFANEQIKADIQSLVEAQYQSATAFFLRKDFKTANQVASSIFAAYPVLFVGPDERAKVESLADRTRRALALAKMDSSAVFLRSEEPFNPSYTADFAPDTPTAQDKLVSPAGNEVVALKRVGRHDYLYLAKYPAQNGKYVFKIIPNSSGANLPSWSPDGASLVYLRAVGEGRRLERVDIPQDRPKTLFHSEDASLGLYPAFHPSGSKIAFVYGGNVWVVNGDGTDKTLLKTNEKLDYTAHLSWSFDGTLLRCQEDGKKGKSVDEVLVLDAVGPFNP